MKAFTHRFSCKYFAHKKSNRIFATGVLTQNADIMVRRYLIWPMRGDSPSLHPKPFAVSCLNFLVNSFFLIISSLIPCFRCKFVWRVLIRTFCIRTFFHHGVVYLSKASSSDSCDSKDSWSRSFYLLMQDIHNQCRDPDFSSVFESASNPVRLRLKKTMIYQDTV